MKRLLIPLLLFSILVFGRRVSAENIQWQASYFDNPTLSGTPTVTRMESRLQHDWGNGSPANWSLVPPDHFSARWVGVLTVDQAQQYLFDVNADDGVRLFVDGQLLVNRWLAMPNSSYSSLKWLSAGRHTVVVEYREAIGAAHIAVSARPVVADTSQWRGEFFPNPHLSGTPTLVRNSDAVSVFYGNGAPGPWTQVPPDFFSVRWLKRVQVDQPQRVDFSVQADDGVRVWVNNKLVIDRWHNPDVNATYSASSSFDAGSNLVRVEYREYTGRAQIQFRMDGVDVSRDTNVENVPDPVINVPPVSSQTDSAELRYTYHFDNPNAAEIEGMPTATLSPVGNGLAFSGNDGVELTYSAEPFDMGEGDFSMAFWLKTDSTRTTSNLFDMRSTTFTPNTNNCGRGRGSAGPDDCGVGYGYHVYLLNGALGLQLADGRGSQFRCGSSDGTCTNYTSDVVVNDGAWHHIVVTVDRDAQDGIRFYVDGTLRAVDNPTNRHGSLSLIEAGTPDGCADFCPVTYHSTSLAGSIDGAMDEFMLYGGILSAEAIANMVDP